MKPKLRWLATALACTLIVGCMGEEESIPTTDQGNPTDDTTWKNVTPKITLASPGSMAVGDNLVILGQDFISTAYGQASVRLKGTYFNDNGKSNPVDLQATAVRDGTRTDKVAWSLWPNILFDNTTGNHLGYFVGNVTVTNQGADGSALTSEPFPVKISVLPSLIPRLIRPTDTACDNMVSKTIAGTPFQLSVAAVGLRASSQDKPLSFTWTFLADQWTVDFSYGTADPDYIIPKSGAILVREDVTSGNVSTIQDGGDQHFVIKVASDLLGSRSLKKLRTANVPDGGNSYIANVNVAATDASGVSAKLAIALDVSLEVDMSYDGNQRIAERFTPVLVKSCIPSSGMMPVQVSYSEDSAETQVRSLGFNYNVNAGVNLGLPSNPFALSANFSFGVGKEVGSSVSSSEQKGMNMSGQILPGMFGAIYRQTTKLYRYGKLTGRNKCGRTVDLGQAILTDWLFTPELATGSKCDPPSSLPPAQKFLD